MLIFLCYGSGWQIFPVKSQRVNRLGFVGHTLSVTSTQFCHWNMRAAINNTEMAKHAVPIKAGVETEILISCNYHVS